MDQIIRFFDAVGCAVTNVVVLLVVGVPLSLITLSATSTAPLHNIEFITWFALQFIPIGIAYLLYTQNGFGCAEDVDEHEWTRGLFVVSLLIWLTFWYYQIANYVLAWFFKAPFMGSLMIACIGTATTLKELFDEIRLDADEKEEVITLDQLSGRLHKWEQGSSWKFPWEHIRVTIILKKSPRKGKMSFPTQLIKAPTGDKRRRIGGSPITVDWSFNFVRVTAGAKSTNQALLKRVITLTDDAIENAFTGYIQQVLQPIIAVFDPINGFAKQGLDDIKNTFKAATEGTDSKDISEIEKEYDIKITAPSIKISRHEEVESTLTLREAAESLMDEEGEVGYNEAMEKHLINKGKASRSTTTSSAKVSGFTAGEQLAELAMLFAEKINNAVKNGKKDTDEKDKE